MDTNVTTSFDEIYRGLYGGVGQGGRTDLHGRNRGELRTDPTDDNGKSVGAGYVAG